MRNVLSNVPKASGPMVASIIRTIFAQPDTEHVFAQFHEVVRMLTRSHPKIAEVGIIAIRCNVTKRGCPRSRA